MNEDELIYIPTNFINTNTEIPTNRYQFVNFIYNGKIIVVNYYRNITFTHITRGKSCTFETPYQYFNDDGYWDSIKCLTIVAQTLGKAIPDYKTSLVMKPEYFQHTFINEIISEVNDQFNEFDYLCDDRGEIDLYLSWLMSHNILEKAYIELYEREEKINLNILP